MNAQRRPEGEPSSSSELDDISGIAPCAHHQRAGDVTGNEQAEEHTGKHLLDGRPPRASYAERGAYGKSCRRADPVTSRSRSSWGSRSGRSNSPCRACTGRIAACTACRS
jgi:hypothetical protein